MSKYIYTGITTLLFLGAVLAPHAHAETTTTSVTVLEHIKVLMAKLEELKKQISIVRGEMKDVIKDGLSEGMTDASIRDVQELLATDPTLYPEGKVTGFFGPMTKEAIKRFQARHNLQVTGVVDTETKKLLEEYFKERHDGKIPPGLMRAPGIVKKVEDRLALRCDDKKATGPFCKKVKDDGADEDSEKDDDVEYEVEIEIENAITKVTLEIDDKTYKVVLRSTDESKVLEAIASTLKTRVTELNHNLTALVKEELANAIKNADLDGDFDLEIEIDDGDTRVTFLFEGEHYKTKVDNSTKLDDVLDAVADTIHDDDDASDLDDNLKDAIEDMLDDVSSKTDAEEAIDDAADALDDARDEIEDARGATEPADDMADDAEDKLEEAIDEFEDKNYDEATALARSAKRLAQDATGLLPE